VCLFLLFSNALTHAQNTQCSLKLAELPAAPELLGFHIGMTPEQVKVRVPQVKFGKKDKYGVAKTTINPYFDPSIDKTSFEGVRSISLDFLDDHLTSLWIGFDGSFKVTSVEEFVKLISQSLHLPNSWTPWRIRGQQMRCADFQLSVITVSDGPSFRLLDLGADDLIAARREAVEEEESQPIVANKQSKIYYPPGCKPNVEISEADRVLFKSPEEAASAGFKVAGNCQK